MSAFDLFLDLSSIYTGTSPNFEVLLDGEVVSSFSVGSSFSNTTLSLSSIGDFPRSLSFRFNDSNGETNRSVILNAIRINGTPVAIGSLSKGVLLQGQESQVNILAEQSSFGISSPSATTNALINGTAADERLNGTAGDDTINGLDGIDSVRAGAGNDIINGGNGNDVLSGGLGNDTINGDEGNDLLKGEDGDDIINGGNGHDTLDGGEGADELNGGDGNDVLRGANGIDILRGDDGNDILRGDDGNDFLYGEDGNDKLEGGAGNDTLYGGTGLDRLFGGDGDDLLDGEGDSDRLYGEGGNDTLFGRDGNDLLDGGADNDTIFGGIGNDILFGGEGHDILNGEDGNDRIVGGAGNDTINGGAGIDNIDGNEGDDIIFGGGDGDLIKGGEGDDEIHGEDGDDNLYSQEGNDTVFGGNGEDYIYGKEGNDVLNGGNDNDTIRGGEDNDTINGDAGDDVIYGDGGESARGWYFEYYDLTNDPTTLAQAGFTLNGGVNNTNQETSRGVTQNIDPNSFDPGDRYAIKYETYLTITTAGTYTFRTRSDDGSMLFLDGVRIVNNDGLHPAITVTSVGQVLAAGIYKLDVTFFERTGQNVLEVDFSGPDTGNSFISLSNYAGVNAAKSEFIVFTGDDIINGGDGNDTLFGDGGNDTINGDAGNDFITGGTGADIINGGIGNDTFYLANSHFETGESITGGTGIDSIILTEAATIDLSIGTIASVENFIGSSGNDDITYTFQQALSFSSINLGGGIDNSRVQANGTVNVTSLATPTITNAENGFIVGSSGDDTLTISGDQINSLIFGTGNINFNAGIDTLSITSTSADLNALGLSDAGILGLEIVTASSASAAVIISLNNQSEALTITGSNFNDTITGGSGDDIITGGLGVDSLNGGNGDDIFNLSNGDFTGSETLNGGGGNDTVTLLNSTTVNFSTGSLTAIENFNGSNGNDIVTFSITQLNTVGNFNFGSGSDTLSILGTSTGLNALSDANLSNLEIISMANSTATGGIILNLSNQTEGFTIIGSNFVDNITASTGVDIIDAGNGNDVINIANGHFVAGESLTGGAGTDTLLFTNATTVDFTIGTLSTIENLTGSGGNDAVTISGTQLNGFTTINLGAGIDTLNITSTSTGLNGLSNGNVSGIETISASTAGAGVIINLTNQTENFTLTGSNLNDTITGGSGNDTVRGGNGNDVLNGGAGIDTVVFSGNRSNYNISLSGAVYTIIDTTGIEGTDTATLFENFQFADGIFTQANLIGPQTVQQNGTTGNDTIFSNSVEAGLNSFILDILNNNQRPIVGQNGTQDLQYNPDTGNFYQYVFAFSNATQINNSINTAPINGVTGTLAFFETAAEQTWVINNLGANFGGNPTFLNPTIVGDINTADTLLTTLSTNGTFGTASGFRPYIVEWDGDAILGSNNNGGTGTTAILNGGDGSDDLYGAGGIDIFVFENAHIDHTDRIFNFDKDDADIIDLSNILSDQGINVTSANINNFILVNEFNGLRVDTTGSGQFFGANTDIIATFAGDTDIDNASIMLANGTLIV